MRSSDIAAWPRGIRAEAKTAAVLFGFSALIAFGFGIPAAQAQYFPFPWRYPYYDGYPPPMPPGVVYAPRRVASESGPRAVGSDTSVLPLSEIRRRVALLGFHLLAIPRHKDRIYLAEAEDGHGFPHRLVFDAYQGNIIENTKLAAFPKRPKTGAAITTAGTSTDTTKVDRKPLASAKKPANLEP